MREKVPNRALLFAAGGVASTILVVSNLFLSPKEILQQPILQFGFALICSALYTLFFIPAVQKRCTLPVHEFEKRLMMLHAPLYACVFHHVINVFGGSYPLHIFLFLAIAGAYLYLFMRWFFTFDVLIASFLFLFVLGGAFVTRLPFVSMNPQSGSAELSIYLAGGKLLQMGINPYDFQDNVPAREKVRFNRFFFDPYTCETVERWNYYVSGNLPLSLLFYRAIYFISPNDAATTFRMSIALLDSLLSAFVVLFTLLFWKDLHPTKRLFWGLPLAALSPYLIYDGIISIDDKGPQILLMVLALLCTRFARFRSLFFLGALFLGMSISFKGLGVFLIPLCVLYVLNGINATSGILTVRDVLTSRRVYLFLGLAGLFTFAWFLPFMPGVFSMMSVRLSSSAAMDSPIHASMWRYVEHLVGGNWRMIKNVSSAVLLALGFYGYWKRRITLEVLTAILLLVFVIVVLVTGAMDRQNIAFTMAILLVGMFSGKEAMRLTLLFFGSGVIAYIVVPVVFRQLGIPFDEEYPQSLTALAFLLFFTYRIGTLIFARSAK